MTIVEHLEELRKRLLYSLAAFGVATSAGYLFVERILAVVLRPVGPVVFLAPTEAFFVRLKLAVLAGGGVVTPASLTAGRKYALLAIVTASAVLTPGGDVVSQMLMAVPTYILYEVSIWVARLVSPRPVAQESPETN